MDQNTQLQTIDTEQVSVVISKAPEVLSLNKTTLERAEAAAQGLLDTVEGQGMSDELDAAINKHLVKVNEALTRMNERRKPVTQIMDMLKKEFTTLESVIDRKTKGSKNYLLQEYRDKYAAQKAAERKEAERQAELKLAQDKELIRIKSECQLQLATFLNDYMSRKLNELNDLFSSITLDGFESRVNDIRFFTESYPHDHFRGFLPNSRPVYASIEQVMQISKEVTAGKESEFGVQFQAKIKEAKAVILDRVHSKKAELEEIAKAKAEAEKAAAAAKSKAQKEAAAKEAARIAEMENQVKLRDDAEKARLAREEEERKLKSESDIAIAQQAEETNALFDAQVSVAAAPQQVASVRESFEIMVMNPLGYLLIAQLYFEKYAKNAPVEELGKRTLDQMKKFAEKYALDQDERLSSPWLSYKEKFKTVAKKAS